MRFFVIGGIALAASGAWTWWNIRQERLCREFHEELLGPVGRAKARLQNDDVLAWSTSGWDWGVFELPQGLSALAEFSCVHHPGVPSTHFDPTMEVHLCPLCAQERFLANTYATGLADEYAERWYQEARSNGGYTN